MYNIYIYRVCMYMMDRYVKYIYICIYRYMSMYIYIYIERESMCIYIYAHIYIYIYIYVYIWEKKYIYIYACTWIYMYIWCKIAANPFTENTPRGILCPNWFPMDGHAMLEIALVPKFLKKILVSGIETIQPGLWKITCCEGFVVVCCGCIVCEVCAHQSA